MRGRSWRKSAVKGTFTGYVQITDQQEPNHYKLLVEGSGGPGFVKGEGTMDLTDDGDGTQVAVVGDAQVGGMIAGVGQRVIAPTAKMMMNQFFGCMQRKIEAKAQGSKTTS